MKCLRPLLLAALLFLAAARASGAAALPVSTRAERLPGVELADGIAQLTGVAISPLLGVSSVGAWRYYHAPPEERARLPWFCQPYLWGAAFFLLGVCFLKDLFGTVSPPFLKKPLDILELFESKLSALVACSAFLPFIVSQMAPHTLSGETAGLHGANGFLASMNLAGWFDLRLITIPLAMVGFLTVWLAAHAINVLIALCPFGFIDSLLKLGKAALLSTVVASSFVSPFLGAAVSVAIILVAVRVAPWAFRLTVFGSLFGLDVLLPHRGRRRLRTEEPHAFLARAIGSVPVRTYGRLARSQAGELTFVYRPWLLLPARTVTLDLGEMAVAKGVLFPSLLHAGNEQKPRAILVMFLPRYRSHEQTIAAHFEIVEIVDSPLMKGFRAVRQWLAETLSWGRARPA